MPGIGVFGVTVHVDDPVAGKMVRRVTAARLAFLETAYRDLGLDADSSRRHSLIAYATYLGHFQLVGALDNEWRSLCDEPGYLQQVLTTLEP